MVLLPFFYILSLTFLSPSTCSSKKVFSSPSLSEQERFLQSLLEQERFLQSNPPRSVTVSPNHSFQSRNGFSKPSLLGSRNVFFNPSSWERNGFSDPSLLEQERYLRSFPPRAGTVSPILPFLLLTLHFLHSTEVTIGSSDHSSLPTTHPYWSKNDSS